MRDTIVDGELMLDSTSPPITYARPALLFCLSILTNPMVIAGPSLLSV